MKKNAVVLFFIAIMLLAVTAAVSAQSEGGYVPTSLANDPYAYGSKVDYYWAIDIRLNSIRDCLANNDLEGAQKAMEELRLIVYRCARYLASINQYDWRIMNVIVFAEEAFGEGADVKEHVEDSRELAAEILLDKKPLTPGGTPSYYYYDAGAGAAEETEEAEEEQSHS